MGVGCQTARRLLRARRPIKRTFDANGRNAHRVRRQLPPRDAWPLKWMCWKPALQASMKRSYLDVAAVRKAVAAKRGSRRIAQQRGAGVPEAC